MDGVAEEPSVWDSVWEFPQDILESAWESTAQYTNSWVDNKIQDVFFDGDGTPESLTPITDQDGSEVVSTEAYLDIIDRMKTTDYMPFYLIGGAIVLFLILK